MILVVGDAGVDLTVRVSHVPEADEKVHASESHSAAGGVALNTAVALRRLGSPAALAAEIGTDPFGDTVAAALAAEAVDTRSVARTPRTSTYYTFSMLAGDDAEKRMVVVPTRGLYPRSVVVSDLLGVSWCHTVPFGFDVATDLVEMCRRQQIPFSLDLEPAALAGRAGQLETLVRGADTVIMNQRSAGDVGSNPHDAIERVLSFPGVAAAVVTLGGEGVLFGEASGTRGQQSAYVVDAVDTTGAGDAFAAGYIHLRAAGAPVVEAVDFAAAAGALCATGIGARGVLPSAADVRQLQARFQEVQS